MVRAKLKNIKPKTMYVNKDVGKYTIFMEEMQPMIGKAFDFDKVNKTDYTLARSDYNFNKGMDEYFFLLVFAKDWLEIVSSDFSTVDDLSLPEWISKIINQKIL